MIGAGSVVTRGHPGLRDRCRQSGRVMRFRFEGSIQEAVEKSRWWELPRQSLAGLTFALQAPLTEENCPAILERLANAREH